MEAAFGHATADGADDPPAAVLRNAGMRVPVPALLCLLLFLPTAPDARAQQVMAAVAAPAEKAVPETGRIAFRVIREEVEIGAHEVRFRRDGDRLDVEVEIDLNVTFLGMSLYRYRHRALESWSGGRLVALQSTTDDNGERHEVSGSAGPDGFIVRTAAGKRTFPADAMPSSHWNPLWLEGRPLINTQTGQPIDFSVRRLGTETVATASGATPAERFAVSGALRKDIWFDAGGRWAATRFQAPDGSTISYLRK